MQNVKTFFRMFRQLSEILNDTEKKKAIAIAVLSIFSALLETLGVGVILPFISYGGTSMSILVAEMGLALSVSKGIELT